MKNAKQAIHSSFRTLLLAKSLDKITVRDIVEDCGLTRNTFYYHYEDIYDLFDDYLDTKMQESLARAGGRWDEILFLLLDCVCETPQMGRHIFYSKKHDAMKLYLNKVLMAALERYISTNMAGLTVTAEDRRLVCDTCGHALYGLIDQLLTGPEAPQLVSRLSRITHCFEGAIRLALEYCEANPEERRDTA